MAKRGRKKRSKVTALSTQDKNHLKRIMAKVRLIKANKKANAPAVDLAGLQSAQRNLTQQLISLSGNPAAPGFQTKFNLISGQLLSINAQIAQALAAARS